MAGSTPERAPTSRRGPDGLLLAAHVGITAVEALTARTVAPRTRRVV